MKFSEKLSLWMMQNGSSTVKLAEEGVASQSTVARWVKEGRSPRIEELEGLARHTGIAMAYWCDEGVVDMRRANLMSSATDAEVDVIEKARHLGVEEAGFILATAMRLGLAVTFARLLGQSNRPVGGEGAQEGGVAGEPPTTVAGVPDIKAAKGSVPKPRKNR